MGNLKAERDFTDVRDQVRSIRLLTEGGEAGQVYNLSSGHATSMQTVIDILVGLARKPIAIVHSASLERPTDEPLILGDNRRLVTGFGWKPQVRAEADPARHRRLLAGATRGAHGRPRTSVGFPGLAVIGRHGLIGSRDARRSVLTARPRRPRSVPRTLPRSHRAARLSRKALFRRFCCYRETIYADIYTRHLARTMSRTLLSVLVILVLGGLLLSAFPASAQSGVHASKGPTVYAPIASRPRADVGQAVFFNVTVNGGVAPFTYQWLGLPSGCSSSNSSSLTCIPNGTGVFPIHVAVVDTMGNSGTGTRLNYTVTNDPVVTITATPSTVRAGQTVQFGMVLVGGAQWWVDWNWSGLPPACRGPPSTGGLYPCTSLHRRDLQCLALHQGLERPRGERFGDHHRAPGPAHPNGSGTERDARLPGGRRDRRHRGPVGGGADPALEAQEATRAPGT